VAGLGLLAAVFACLAAVPVGAAAAEQVLVLKDGRRYPVTLLERRRGRVEFRTVTGERYSVPEDQVASPPLATIATPGVRPPPPPRPARVRRPKPPRAAPGPRVEPALGAPVQSTPAPPPPLLFEAVPLPQPWSLGFPDGTRGPRAESAVTSPRKLKGEAPVLGDDVYFAVTGVLDAPVEARRVPVPSGSSSAHPDRPEFFGRGDQLFMTPRIMFSAELFRPRAAFRPKAWAVKATGIFNLSVLRASENPPVSADARQGTNRARRQLALQEAYAEAELARPRTGFVSLRAGLQPFVSDFRGFVFSETNLGARLFGTLRDNRLRYNLAYFDLLEKDTYSGLNTFARRQQRVMVANLYVHDAFTPGYTVSVSLLRSEDHASTEPHYDRTGLLVRPARVGTVRLHQVDANYLGLCGQGRWGPLDVSHATYLAFGADKHNPIAGRHQEIVAGLFAFEGALRRGGTRYRLAAMIASGEDEMGDKRSSGFDGIVDLTDFGGGPFSFWSRSALVLPQTGLQLKGPGSLLPNLRSSRLEGQANFVNPGLLLVGLGLERRLTSRLDGVLGANYLWFHNTDSLEAVLFQNSIDHSLGLDVGAGVVYRPRTDGALVVAAGVTGFVPSIGFDDVFRSFCSVPGCGSARLKLVNAFVELRLTY
jgi:hypothetical protein